MDSIINYLASNSSAALAATAIVSLLVGSFLNVVIHRTPRMMEREWQREMRETLLLELTPGAEEPEQLDERQRQLQQSQCSYSQSIGNWLEKAGENSRYNLAVPRSSCPHCQHDIRWYENIPLISYLLLLKGKCSQCKAPISKRYPLVELLTAVLSCVVIDSFGVNFYGAAALLFTWLLVAMTFIDLDTQLLPDSLTLPLLWLGLLVNLDGSFASLDSAVLGAAAGYLSLWSIYWAFKLLTGKEGMGYGDFKLLAALGAWCGAASLPLLILLSSVVGIISAIIMAANKSHQLSRPMPFGPYLAIAGWITLLWGEQITRSYLAFIL